MLASALALGSPEVWHIESLILTGCKDESFNTPCTVTTVALGLLLLLRTSLNVGTLERHGTEVLYSCPSLVFHCIVSGLPKIDAEGTTSTQMLPMLDTLNTSVTLSGPFCPATAHWKAKYEIVLPDLLYILE